jgi:phosphopantothenoylcysteine synthetase/decarboxylase
MQVLVTAGATRNPIDAMRFISANSSGRTGVRLARAWQAAGHSVHFLGSPEAVLRYGEGSTETFGSTRDLMDRMERWVLLHPHGAVVHAAAVGDYECAEASSSKLPSGRPEVTLALTPTPKIANAVRGWGLRGCFVTFKAAAPETSSDELLALARAQRERTQSDLVFANVLGRLGQGIAIVGDGVTWFDRRDEALEALISAVTSAR